MGIFSTLGTAIGTVLGKGNPIGTAVGTASGGLLDRVLAQDDADQAYQQGLGSSALALQQSTEQYKQRYRYTVNDMREAGLNPILAATGGFSVGSSPSIQGNQSFQTNYPWTDFGNSAKNISDSQKSNQEIEESKVRTQNLLEQRKLLIQQTKHEFQKINHTRQQANLFTKQEELTQRQIFNLEQEFTKTSVLINKLNEEIDLIRQQQTLSQAHTEQSRALKKQIEQNKTLLYQTGQKIVAETSRLNRISEVYDGPIGNILGYLEATFKYMAIPFLLTGGAVGIGSKLLKNSKIRNGIIRFINKSKMNKVVKRISK